MSWEITHLYFFSWNFILFWRKQSINVSNFRLSILSNLYFDRLLLLKVYKISAKKVQRSCVSWHWRLMQNLKKNWFVVSKLTRIWWIFIRALKSLKNLHFDWFLAWKVCNAWSKKSTEKLSFMTLGSDVKFEGNWLLLSKMTWGIWEIFTRALESLKIGTLMGFFCSKLKMYELKTYVKWTYASRQWRMMQKLKRNWLVSWHLEFDQFWFDYSKISKICTLIGCLWPKYIMFELKKYRGVMFDCIEYWYKIWRKTDFHFQK